MANNPKGFRLQNHNQERVNRIKNVNGFINKCIDFYFDAEDIANVNPKMTAQQLIKEVKK